MINHMKKISLSKWILIGMLLGILTGVFLNLFVKNLVIKDLILIDNVFYFGGELFIKLMKMIVVPLVFTSIVMSLASISDIHKLGTIGLKAMLFYITFFIIALTISFIIATLIKPGIGLTILPVGSSTNVATNLRIIDTILDIIPENPINALTNGIMLSILLFGTFIGYILIKLKKETTTVKNIFKELNHIMNTMTNTIMKFAPIGIFCLMARNFGTLGLNSILPLAKLIISLTISCVILLFIVFPIFYTIFTRTNPLKFYKKYLPVMFFAFSSCSSNATLPLNINTLEKMGFSRDISSFTIPLGIAFNQSGAIIFFGSGVLFASQAYGIHFGISTLLMISFIIYLVSLSTPAVPMSSIVSLTVIFNTIGLPLPAIDLIMGVITIIDMLNTTTNVTSNGINTAIITVIHDSFDVNRFNKA